MAKVADVVAAVRRTLQDYDADYHDDPAIVARVNGARRALCEALPKTYATSIDHPLAEGSLQTLPADCHLFQDILYAIEPEGDVSRSISVAQREYLDALEPRWRAGEPGVPVHFMFDERRPKEFEVYPPADVGFKVRLSFVRMPTDLALNDDLSPQETQLQDSLADYALFRLLSEDAESPVSMNRATYHAQLFASATGASLTQLLKTSPNTANVGGRLPKSATGE